MSLKALEGDASSFCLAGDWCIELETLPNGEYQAPVFPALVNYAFSIELYLKYLIAKEKMPHGGSGLTKLFKACGGHKLEDLFNSIDNVTRYKIIKVSGYEKSEFESKLNKYSNSFVEFRYSYEGKIEFPIDILFFKRFAHALKSISSEI